MRHLMLAALAWVGLASLHAAEPPLELLLLPKLEGDDGEKPVCRWWS